jgi:hypothetical protein
MNQSETFGGVQDKQKGIDGKNRFSKEISSQKSSISAEYGASSTLSL